MEYFEAIVQKNIFSNNDKLIAKVGDKVTISKGERSDYVLWGGLKIFSISENQMQKLKIL